MNICDISPLSSIIHPFLTHETSALLICVYIYIHRLVGGLEHFFLFFHILALIIPTDELTFFRGVAQPPVDHTIPEVTKKPHQYSYVQSHQYPVAYFFSSPIPGDESQRSHDEQRHMIYSSKVHCIPWIYSQYIDPLFT